MVKPPHSISSIFASIAHSNGRFVRLERIVNGSAGPAPAVDPTQATINALAQPLEHPALALAIVPGDRVALPVDETVPHVAEVVRGVVFSLRSAGVEDEAISVITRDAATGNQCRLALAESHRAAVQLIVHDPEDDRELCMVGMTKRHGPLLVNRAIFDADVILPIGCARLHGRGVFESLFPRFSNAETIARFQSPSQLDSAAARQGLRRETDEAGWLIGVPMVILTVPGRDETVSHVLAGEPRAVGETADQLCRNEWVFRSPQRASLVIATLTGGAETQSWNSVGQALAAVEQLVDDGGAIAICSNLDRPPGPSLGRLIGTDDLALTERRLLRDHAEDSWPAWQLARALQRGPVYFLSQLSAETVEDMGLAPIADIAELMRLASRHESVAVLPDSQHAIAALTGDDDL